MAYFQRLVFAAFVLFSAWVPSAHASVPATAGVNCQVLSGSGIKFSVVGGSETTCTAAGQLALPGYKASYSGSTINCNTAYPSTSGCTVNGQYGNVYTLPVTWLASQSCPSNSTLSGSACSCNSGYVENSTQTACEVYVDPQTALCQSLAAGGMTTYATAVGSLSPGGTSCGEIGCQLTWSDTLIRVTDKTTGVTTTQGDASITATPCTPVPATQAVETTCKGVAGVVNGVSTCVEYDPNTNVIESTKKTTTDQTATGPEGAASSSTSAISNTVCTGAGSCTTTTTTTVSSNGGAPTTTTEAKTESKDDYCKSNPSAIQCTDSGTFSGTCGTTPACTGDAVNCAVAKAAFETSCALNPESSDESQAYAAALASSASIPSTSVDLGPSNFDQSELLGAGSGLSDFNVTVMGSTVTIGMSLVNTWLGRLGLVLQALAFLLAIRIVGRGY